MAKIFTGAARVGAARVLDPVARGLLRLGVTPDAVTVAGFVGVAAGAVGFAARGEFLLAVLVVVVFAPVDTLDGAMARIRGSTSRFGAFLDSSVDRLSDGVVLGSIAYWYATGGDDHLTLAVTLVGMVASQLVSYVKARAQSLGFDCDVGIAERAERLILIGLGGLVTGLGVGWALPAALWLLAILSLITVAQRVIHVRQQARAGKERT
jgi:CDP-diacylglycerol--glycerol-3-phosphate 3-phosphatidyltransferase